MKVALLICFGRFQPLKLKKCDILALFLAFNGLFWPRSNIPFINWLLSCYKSFPPKRCQQTEWEYFFSISEPFWSSVTPFHLKRVALLLAELYANLLKTGENKNVISSQIKRDRTILRLNGDHFEANLWIKPCDCPNRGAGFRKSTSHLQYNFEKF